MEVTKPDFQVGIIGGGPAGASMAAYLGKAGVSCVVFEGEIFPRPHVGESLVPSSGRVFKDLNFLPVMEEAKFPHKYGAAWTAASTKTGAYNMDWHDLNDWREPGTENPGNMAPDTHAEFRFEERKQEGVDRIYTYHVDRGKFDLLLLQHAQKLGASVYEGVRVTRVDFEPKNPVIHFKMGQKEMGVSVNMVIDASGRKTFLGNQLKLKIQDPVFDQYAIHTWFDDYDRGIFAKGDAQGDYIFIHFLPISNTWVWQIPITHSVTSIGVVTQKKNFSKSKDEREKFFWDTLASRPELHDGLRKAKQVHPLKDEGDYSYAMKQICGDRFMLLGDAGRFVDPIFSTGVSIALNSSRFAKDDVLAALEKGDFSRQSFSNFENTLRRGTKNWYEFINVYYRLNVLFTYFVNEKKYRLDVLKLLQGDVYDEEAPEVLTKMKAMVAQVERNEKHPWHKLLGDLTSDAFRPEVNV
jgi:1H-pyrrole-2-carbonyl-[peptidyl-carrier protein] chlorinase